MSRSPARAASVSSHTWNPSGSSVAIEPASTSCASGTRSRTMRNASITPTGSFHGSKRLTWQTIGRCTSTPYWLGELLAERHRQLEVLHRERVDARRRVHARAPCRATSGTNSGIVHTDASCSSTNGRKNSHTVGVGVGEVDVAAPDPLGVAHLAAEALAQEAEHALRAAGRG